MSENAEQTLAEVKKQVEELEGRDRAKDNFLAMLAHELRNPLGAISNALEVARQLGTECDLRTPLETAERQISLMSRLINDLLDVTRITLGKISLQKNDVFFARIVDQTVRDLLPRAKEKNLVVRVFTDPQIRVFADPVRLEQIVSNLVSNAIKYTAAGEIEVRLEQETARAVLTVCDTGSGIKAELLPRLFDTYTQGDYSQLKSEGGLGLGLSIVKQLVALHHGTISVESSQAGSIFKVSLPLTREESPDNEIGDSPTEFEQRPLTAICTGAKALVVDDDPDSLAMTSTLLELWGLEVITAADGRQAIEQFDREKPQFVLLDLQLPELDGFEVVRYLRGKTNSPQPLIIAVTGYGLTADQKDARDAGFDHLLVKPLDFESLRKVLAAENNIAS